MLPPAAALPPGAGELPLRAYSAVASSSRLAVASANPAGALPLAVLAADCRLSSHGLPLCAGAPGHGGVQEAASPASPTVRLLRATRPPSLRGSVPEGGRRGLERSSGRAAAPCQPAPAAARRGVQGRSPDLQRLETE
ncbi:unnamed protein product, partial [Prorocentrum cordatum]